MREFQSRRRARPPGRGPTTRGVARRTSRQFEAAASIQAGLRTHNALAWRRSVAEARRAAAASVIAAGWRGRNARVWKRQQLAKRRWVLVAAGTIQAGYRGFCARLEAGAARAERRLGLCLGAAEAIQHAYRVYEAPRREADWRSR